MSPCLKILKILLYCSLFASAHFSALSHPIPDLPVFGLFENNGSAKIILEIDPRAFSEDPEAEPFLTDSIFKEMNMSAKKSLLQQGKVLVARSLLVRTRTKDWFLPDFDFQFDKKADDENNETIILVRASAKLNTDRNDTYQIRSLETSPLDLIFTNQINGIPHRRVNVLFPGEESFVLNLPTLENDRVKITKSMEPSWDREVDQSESKHIQSTFLSFARQGFLHVLPLGLDHILFVLGIFLLSREWKPLVLQVSTFTLAHTITLGLATIGWVSLPSSVVEPIIAASIAFVALENIFFPQYTARRLILVFFFGLIHGLGFAGALSDLNLDPSVLIVSLVGFNIGVEGGQLAVVLLSWVGVFPLRDEKAYRKRIVIPLSLSIAGLGIFWTIERILG